MKTLKYFLSTSLAIMLMASCTRAQNEASKESIAKDVSADEFEKLISEKPGQLIDVRTPGEHALGYIPNARLIDYKQTDFEQNIDKLDKTKPVYVYCASGGRSGRAMAMMKEKGFVEIYNLIGGFSNWSISGKASVKPE